MPKSLIKTGDAVRLIETFEHLPKGTIGIANTVVNVDKTYIWFMPATEFQIYVLEAERFELIPEDEAKSMELVPEIPEDLQDVLTQDKDDVIAYTNQ